MSEIAGISTKISGTSTNRQGILRFLRTAAFEIGFWFLGIGLIGANVMLLRQNHALEAAASGPDTSVNIQEGKHLGRNLAAATLDNSLRPITFAVPNVDRTLVITFSPVCPHCRANHQNWSTIATELRQRGGWRIVWVSRDPIEMTKDYCEDSAIPVGETFADPSHRTYVMLDLREVPNTLVVDNDGVVQRLWPGELDSAGWKDVFTYLQIPTYRLPPS